MQFIVSILIMAFVILDPVVWLSYAQTAENKPNILLIVGDDIGFGEGGVRVPLIVIPPKGQKFVRAGQKTNEYTHVKDLPMTILDYAGVEHPQTEYKGRKIVPPSGVSMRNFFEGSASSPRKEEQWVAFELFGNSYVVAGDYKAIRVRTAMYGDGKWHLYNIKKDPGETRPLDAEYSQRLEKMIAIYEQYAKDKGIVPVADNWSPWHGFIEENKQN